MSSTPVQTSTPNKIAEMMPRPNEYDHRRFFRLTFTGCRWRKMLLVMASERSSGLSGQPCRKNERQRRDWVRREISDIDNSKLQNSNLKSPTSNSKSFCGLEFEVWSFASPTSNSKSFCGLEFEVWS